MSKKKEKVSSGKQETAEDGINYICKVGDFVWFGSKLVCVSEILSSGHNGYLTKDKGKIKPVRSYIVVHPMIDQQVLKRSIRYVGTNWKH